MPTAGDFVALTMKGHHQLAVQKAHQTTPTPKSKAARAAVNGKRKIRLLTSEMPPSGKLSFQRSSTFSILPSLPT